MSAMLAIACIAAMLPADSLMVAPRRRVLDVTPPRAKPTRQPLVVSEDLDGRQVAAQAKRDRKNAKRLKDAAGN